MNLHAKTDRGAIALITIVLIGAMIVSIGIAAAFLGQTDSVTGADLDFRNQAVILASACVDEAAYRLKLDSAYVGGSVPLGNDTCTVSVSGSGASRTVTATATLEGRTKRILATFTRKQNAQANATGWTVETWSVQDVP